MKNLKTIAIALFVAVSTLATAQTKKVDASKSTVAWIGKKVTGQHNGTINLKDGALVFKKSKLKGGTFTVDMSSINTTDLTGEYKGKLDGHLKADDFFGTDKYPTSKLVFKKIADKGNGVYAVTADLTIKDITNPIKFDITVKGSTASTSLKIDRTKYGIKYGSGSFFDNLGDKTINDEFQLDVTLQF
ncbi:MAG: YceI family protein [Flavobacterium sp.]|uniref:YceI family protein n=1 Tax=Flavobacterium sp. TaxID=239 RepID=UPI0022CD1C8D|nr:YceI family protein [Flavobacterium sp.]MCZ8196623.1 YceI family protein [Flavobacterium sp.]